MEVILLEFNKKFILLIVSRIASLSANENKFICTSTEHIFSLSDIFEPRNCLFEADKYFLEEDVQFETAEYNISLRNEVRHVMK